MPAFLSPQSSHIAPRARPVRPSGHTRALCIFVGMVLWVHPVPAEADEPFPHDDLAPSERPLLTLEEAFALADRRSPLQRAAAAGLASAEAQQLEARRARHPRFEANALLAPVPGIGEEQEDASDIELLRRLFVSVGPWVRADASAIVPLSTFGRIRTLRELAQVGVDVALIEEENARLVTRHQVYQAYVVLQWYREVDRLLVEAEERLDLAEEELEDRLDDGDRSARNHLRQLTIARTELVRLRGEADRADLVARRLLHSALGVPRNVRTEPLDESPVEGAVPDLDDVLETAWRSRPDMQQLDSAVDARRLQTQLERRSWSPDAFAAANIRGAWAPSIENREGPFVYNPYNSFSIGVAVGLRWRIDPWGHAARVQRTDARLAQIEAQRDGARLLVEGDIADAWVVASNSLRLLQAQERALRAARAWLNQVSFQFDQGLADFDDLIEPLQAYYREAGAWWETLLRHRLAVAELALQTGQADLTRWPSADDAP